MVKPSFPDICEQERLGVSSFPMRVLQCWTMREIRRGKERGASRAARWEAGRSATSRGKALPIYMLSSKRGLWLATCCLLAWFAELVRCLCTRRKNRLVTVVPEWLKRQQVPLYTKKIKPATTSSCGGISANPFLTAQAVKTWLAGCKTGGRLVGLELPAEAPAASPGYGHSEGCAARQEAKS